MGSISSDPTVSFSFGSNRKNKSFLNTFNSVLLSKFLWRFAVDNDGLRKCVIQAKYGCNLLGWFSGGSNKAYGCSLWKYIIEFKNLFSDCILFKVGNGERVHFWKGRWCGDKPFCVVFRDVFDIVANKDALVCVYFQFDSTGICWNAVFVMNAYDWELGRFGTFLRLHILPPSL